MYKKFFFDFFAVLFPKTSVKILYKKRTKKTLNLEKPITFDEKIQWMKFYNQDRLIIQCADKYDVRKYIENKGFGYILTRLYGVYNNVEEIDLDDCPKKFVIKVTNGCKMNLVINDIYKENQTYISNQVRKWMKEDFGKVAIEPHYSQAKGKIIVEEYLEDKTGKFPDDYKFFCFNGIPKFVEVMTDRNEKNEVIRHFYDLNWKKRDWTIKKNKSILKKPDNFDEMIRIAQALSQDFVFVRVDLYNIDGKIVFGELTFTPSSGISPYLTDAAQLEIGAMLELPKEKKIGFK